MTHHQTIELAFNNNIPIPPPDTSLQLACMCGNVKVAEELLKKGANVNANVNAWGTPLALACNGKSLSLIKLLLSHHADLSLVVDLGFEEAKVCLTAMAELGLSMNIVIGSWSYDLDHLGELEAIIIDEIQFAIVSQILNSRSSHRQLIEFQQLLRHGFDSMIFQQEIAQLYHSQLLEVFSNMERKVVLAVMELGWFHEIAAAYEHCRSSLLIAACSMHRLDVAEQLIVTYQASFTMEGIESVIAVSGSDAIDLMLSSGFRVSTAANEMGDTLLMLACDSLNLPCVQRLIAEGVSVNSCNHYGLTALHSLVTAVAQLAEGSKEREQALPIARGIIEALVAAGARSEYARGVVQSLEENGFEDLAALLLQ